MISLGERLRSLRRDATQTQVARVFGVKQNTYSAWENDLKEPSLATVRQICSCYRVSSDWLLGIDGSNGLTSVNHQSVSVGGDAINSGIIGGDCSKCEFMKAAAKMMGKRK
jgi:transcriptional regulator with XRE-family HTH domain